MAGWHGSCSSHFGKVYTLRHETAIAEPCWDLLDDAVPHAMSSILPARQWQSPARRAPARRWNCGQRVRMTLVVD